MKVEDLCDALQDIDEKYILEARGLGQVHGEEQSDELRRNEKLEREKAHGGLVRKNHQRASMPFLKWCAVAAVLCLLVWGGSMILRPSSPVGEMRPGDQMAHSEQSSGEEPSSEEEPPIMVQDPEELDLPMIAIVENTGDGMGYEGFWAYSFDELTNNNPWSVDMEIEYLPVYKNPWELDDMFVSPIRDEEAMQEELIRIAEMLGVDTDTAVIENTRIEGAQESYLNYYIDTDAVSIWISETMGVSISFKEGVTIPGIEPLEEYRPTYEEYVIAADHILEEYGEMLGMEDPQIEISGGSRNIYGNQSWYIEIYEGAGETIEERLVNYSFNKVRFSVANGKITSIHGDEVTKVEKIADYPIITLEEAKEKLAKGEYLTSVPFEMPGLEYVAGVELVYDTKILQDYYVPYYKFYVQELDLGNESLEELGLKGYNVYYVPAVEDRYLYFTDNWHNGF